MEIESECFVKRFLQFAIDFLEVDIESEVSVKHLVKYEIVSEIFATHSPFFFRGWNMYPKFDALGDVVLVGSGGVSRESGPVRTPV